MSGLCYILFFGKIGCGFAKGDWNRVFSVELEAHKTSVEGCAHLSPYKHAVYCHAGICSEFTISRFQMAVMPACVLSSFSCIQLLMTLWTVARQAPLSMIFSRQEYWIGLPFPSPEGLPHPGIKPTSLALQADSSLLSHLGSLSCLLLLIARHCWQPTPVLLPGKSHGQRSLVGCSPWGCEELDTTEWLHFDF